VHDFSKEVIESIWKSDEKPYFHLRILGPAGSGTLAAMIREAVFMDMKVDDETFNTARMYSPWSTVDGQYLVPQKSEIESFIADHELIDKDAEKFRSFIYPKEIVLPPGECPQIPWSHVYEDGPLNNVFLHAGFDFFHRIGSDSQLAHALIDELWRRRVFLVPGDSDWCRRNPRSGDTGTQTMDQIDFQENSHRVLLLTEADTLYGRSIVESFKRAVVNRGGEANRVYEFKYLRGLDGVTKSTVSRSASSRSVELTDSMLPMGGQVRGLVPPTGGKQLDYVQRLEERIVKLREEIADENYFIGNLPKNGIKLMAVGIVGHDQYDKLLLLQTLRKRFSDCIFFTLDLDAAFSTQNEYPYTRNVVVASHFGLRLKDKLQSDTFPFRSSYQTSVFYGALSAFRKKPIRDNSLGTAPRIFEIGRSSPRDLSPDKDINTVHPPNDFAPPLFLSNQFRGWSMLIYIFIAALILMFSYTFRAPHLEGPGAGSWRPDLFGWRGTGPDRLSATYRALGITKIFPFDFRVWKGFFWITGLMASSTLVIFVVIWVALENLKDNLGEPLEFWEGVSIWPVVIIRLLVTVFAVFIVLKIQLLDLDKQRRSIMSVYGGVLTDDAERAGDKTLYGNTIKGVLNWYFVRSLFFGASGVQSEMPKMLSRNKRFRLGRVVQIFVIFLLLYLVSSQFGKYFQPVRGGDSFKWDLFARYTTILVTLFLVSCVLDVTLHCRSMLKRLINIINSENWESKDHAEIEQNIKRAKWVTEISASETYAAGKTVYYSFGLLLISLIARSDAFDFFNWPVVIVLLLSLVLTTHLAGIAILYAGARELRIRAGVMLNTIQKNAPSDRPDLRDASSKMRDYIFSIEEGAYQPLFQNELFRLVTIVLAGMGGLIGMDHFMFLF
jgi:hypothetical protein